MPRDMREESRAGNLRFTIFDLRLLLAGRLCSSQLNLKLVGMRLLDLTWPTPAENLACDEALLDWCEESGEQGILRFWEPPQSFVVLGYAKHARREVNLEACRSYEIPIRRRCTGGGTVLQGPGCLNYSLVLKIEAVSPSITETNCLIMKRHQQALASLLGERIDVQGFTDLTVNNLKFSGNAQRRKRSFFLFHGTFLLDFDLSLMEKVLFAPIQQPAYRQNRTHRDFLTRLNLAPSSIKAALQKAWAATEPLQDVPYGAIQRLVTDKYSREEWNLKW